MPDFRVETYGELHPHLEREWLLTNGTGSFAMGTAVGCNTRRYHGLLVAATIPPVGRVMALNRVAETVALDDEALPTELSTNQFGDLFLPRGDRYLRKFELLDTARFEYDADGVRVTKEVLLAWGRPAVGIRYTIDPGRRRKVQLRLMPFVSMRDFHALRHKDGTMFELQPAEQTCLIGQNGMNVQLGIDKGRFEPRPDWWYDHTYAIERERGMDHREDLFTPGAFVVDASTPTTVTFWAQIGQAPAGGFEFEQELVRYREKHGIKPAPSRSQQRLFRAAGQFVAKRNRPGGSQGATILAGFPWFGDWGRDTMIALPGLLLTTGRWQQAGQVLSVFAGHVSQGMIPNYFDDYSNEPSFNTVDASLWFVHACFEYLRVTKDRDLFDSLLRPACEDVVEGYRDGTRFDIRMDPADALLSAGSPGDQLTWMDAKIGDEAFTPRHGKAVEINALWYNALRLLGENELADRVLSSFPRTFWHAGSAYRGLADVVNENGVDKRIRPNQIYAVSLPHSPLDRDKQLAVVEVVRRELLTPFGLRTLASTEPGYIGRYRGGPYDRDRAYHNGTIWPWLIGGFLEAYLKVHDRSEEARKQARTWLQPLVDSMESGCLGSISECYEADPPHRPVAACAQAWSVAEVLRLAVELEM